MYYVGRPVKNKGVVSLHRCTAICVDNLCLSCLQYAKGRFSHDAVLQCCFLSKPHEKYLMSCRKTNPIFWALHPAKTEIRLGIPV